MDLILVPGNQRLVNKAARDKDLLGAGEYLSNLGSLFSREVLHLEGNGEPAHAAISRCLIARTIARKNMC